MWGTGLGALPAGNSDAAGAPFGNLPASVQVLVGGVPATITYQGRTPSAVGLDQINFVVPATAPLGCNVSIIVQTAGATASITSDGPTMSLATADGATCSDPTQFIPNTDLGRSSTKVLFTALKRTPA